MTTNLNAFQTLTAADIFTAYAAFLLAEGRKADLANTQTTLVRFTIPGWSNVYPASKKSTADEVTKSLAFLSQVTAAQFKEALSVQEQVFNHLQLDKSHRRKTRSPLTRMMAWAETQGYFGSTAPESETTQKGAEVTLRLSAPKGQRSKRAADIRLRSTPARKPYALGTQPGDYINDGLQKQLDGLVTYLSNGRRQTTIKKNLQASKQLLGWLHREQNIPLDALSLESIVPFSPLKPKLDDYRRKKGKDKGIVDRQRYADAKFTLEEEAEEQANQTVQRLTAYLTWQGSKPVANVLVIGAVKNVAKFLYHQETKDRDFADIIVIKKVRALCCEHAALVKKTPPTVPRYLKSIPWEEALEVVRKVQQEADLRTQPCKRKPLAERAIARNIQRLLILLFFMAYPPDRSRTVYELEVGRTLVFGHYANGKFKNVEQMKNKADAAWWLHLLPADYKTGDTYEEVWDKLPDTPTGFLGNGKTLYYYIDLWQNKYRAVFKPTHKCLLTSRVGKPLNAVSMYKRVRELFFKHTGIPVTPKELRTMYVTYLKDSRATEAELEGAAARQRHSRKMQSEVYDQQERDKKVAPITDFHRRSIEAFFKDKDGEIKVAHLPAQAAPGAQ